MDLMEESRQAEKGKSKRLTHRVGCGFWGGWLAKGRVT